MTFEAFWTVLLQLFSLNYQTFDISKDVTLGSACTIQTCIDLTKYVNAAQ